MSGNERIKEWEGRCAVPSLPEPFRLLMGYGVPIYNEADDETRISLCIKSPVVSDRKVHM